MTIIQGLKEQAKLNAQKDNIALMLKKRTNQVQKLTELVSKPEGNAVKETIINLIKDLEEYIKSHPQDLKARMQLSDLKMIVNQ